MRTDIFDHFIPIVWQPGHMGSFLQNFLTQEKSYPIPLSEPMGMISNKEWLFADPFDNFFGTPKQYYNDVYDSLSDTYSGLELVKQAAVKVLEQRYKRITGTDEVSFDILKNNSSRYIKEHNFNKHIPECSNSEVKWKNKKINCQFPLEYSWIPYFLIQYKFKRADIHQPFLIEYNKMYSSRMSSSFSKVNQWNKNRDPVNEYTDFNIYNLVINKNLDQVYGIDPNFIFDKDKQDMLDLANTTTLDVLESFNLDPTWCIDDTTTVSEVLRKPFSTDTKL